MAGSEKDVKEVVKEVEKLLDEGTRSLQQAVGETWAKEGDDETSPIVPTQADDVEAGKADGLTNMEYTPSRAWFFCLVFHREQTVS